MQKKKNDGVINILFYEKQIKSVLQKKKSWIYLSVISGKS